jgi:hypothetical protein
VSLRFLRWVACTIDTNGARLSRFVAPYLARRARLADTGFLRQKQAFSSSERALRGDEPSGLRSFSIPVTSL